MEDETKDSLWASRDVRRDLETGDREGDAGEDVDVPKIQVIGLEIAGERFLIDILNVREIARFEGLEITRVPQSHPYILGVMNLRGKVVPVVDLAHRLGLRESGGRPTRMIVVEMGDQLVGFTVDQVSQVLRLPENAIAPLAAKEDFVAGTATIDGRITTMLDLRKMFVAPVA